MNQRPRLAEPSAIVRLLAWTIFASRLVLFDTLEVLRNRSINDYGSFHAAAYAISDGLDPYAPAQLQAAAVEAGVGPVHPYFYPPLFAELLVPLTWLQPMAARMAWGVLSTAAFFGAMYLLDRWLARTVEGARADHARAAFAIAMCSFWPIRETQWGGQVNGLVLALMVAWWTTRERTPKAAIALGAAVAIKMSPALLILVPLSQRRFREAAIAAGTAGALIVLSCAALGGAGMRFLSSVLGGFLPGHQWHGLRVPVDVSGNHSLAAFAYWLVDRNAVGSDHLHLSGGAALVQLALAAGLLVLWGTRSRSVGAEASVASLTILMIVAPTFAFEHHLAFAVLSIGALIALVFTGKVTPAWIVASAVAIALLAETHVAFALPAGAPPWLASLSRISKLAPLLVVYGAALASGRTRATEAPSEGGAGDAPSQGDATESPSSPR